MQDVFVDIDDELFPTEVDDQFGKFKDANDDFQEGVAMEMNGGRGWYRYD